MQPNVGQSWQNVHQVLTRYQQAGPTASDLFGFATYYYCVYKALGQEQNAAPAQRLFKQLTAHLSHQSFAAWQTLQLDQVCTVAWLSAHFAADGFVDAQAQALLADLDQELQQEARRLVPCHNATSRSNFFRVLRYFGLRLPGTSSSLRQLLALLPEPPPATDDILRRGAHGSEPILLGLVDGLAAELLLLIKLYKLGFQDNDIKQRVRQSILSLLSVKRDVDFLGHKYSIFPYRVYNHSQEASFSSELSWRRGDMGQSLLLYQAHELLQDVELAKIAELVGLNTLLRTTSHSTQVVSSQLYRGAAGVAHLYRKLYQVSRQKAYREGYLFWLGQTQSWLRQELVTDFYRQREGDLLYGLVGVGLVLLSAVKEVEMDWDAMLL